MPTPTELLMKLIPVLGYEIQDRSDGLGKQFVHLETGKKLRGVWSHEAATDLKQWHGVSAEYDIALMFLTELFSFATLGTSPMERQAEDHLRVVKAAQCMCGAPSCEKCHP